MRIRRTLPVVLAVVIVAVAVTAAVQLRKHAPPEAARLLPGADAFLYVNLKWVRAVNPDHKLPTITPAPEYQQFLTETGFQWERDLDEAACAIHYPSSWPEGGTAGPVGEPRFSEVLVGKFQGDRLRAYLKRVAQSVENYESIDIYAIPVQGRTFRVAILSGDSVAASNHDDPAVIHGIMDHWRRLASPFSGPALLRHYYKNVPFASVAWAVVRAVPAAPGWNTMLPKPATVVFSARYLRALHLRAEAFTASADDARTITDKINVFLALSHSAENSVSAQGTDPDVKAFFDSVQIRQEGDRAVLSAVVPQGFMHKLLTPPAEPPVSASPESQPATPVKSR